MGGGEPRNKKASNGGICCGGLVGRASGPDAGESALTEGRGALTCGENGGSCWLGVMLL